MHTYGQYCPIAKALEIVGDRWTLLIVRDLLTGARCFNDLERGLPGISRSLLSERLQRLAQAGIVEKLPAARGARGEYRPTEAGWALQPVIDALLVWGTQWSFGDPTQEELDPLLLLWWMRSRVCHERLPRRILLQFDFRGCRGAYGERYWLLLAPDDASICLTPPALDVDLVVETDLGVFYQVWLGRLSYVEARARGAIVLNGPPALERAFPTWFAWSLAAPLVRRHAPSSRGTDE